MGVQCIVSHGFTFLLVGLVLAVAVNTFSLSRHVEFFCKELRWTLWAILGFQVATMLIFTTLQLRWVMESYGQLLQTGDALGWIAYDHANKIFHLTVGIAMNFGLRFQRDFGGRRKSVSKGRI